MVVIWFVSSLEMNEKYLTLFKRGLMPYLNDYWGADFDSYEMNINY